MKSKKEVFKNVNIFFKQKIMIINAFENGFFLLPEELEHKEWSDKENQKFDD